ncbi:hypothetical protein MXB_767, partial [Myxobolus squamalis]
EVESLPANDLKKEKKIKVLVFCQSGVTANVRILSKNIQNMLPHSKTEMKYGKDSLSGINEVCELRNANRCIFFQVKKRRDAYVWFSCLPNGPSVKFLLENIETIDCNFPGNCFVGTRAILSFSANFDSPGPHMQVIKNMLIQLFQTPPSQKNRTLVDHIFNFSFLDGRIWFRNYQIIDSQPSDVIEIGPRFTLNPILIFKGAFCDKIIYKNPDYVPPSM